MEDVIVGRAGEPRGTDAQSPHATDPPDPTLALALHFLVARAAPPPVAQCSGGGVGDAGGGAGVFGAPDQRLRAGRVLAGGALSGRAARPGAAPGQPAARCAAGSVGPLATGPGYCAGLPGLGTQHLRPARRCRGQTRVAAGGGHRHPASGSGGPGFAAPATDATAK